MLSNSVFISSRSRTVRQFVLRHSVRLKGKSKLILRIFHNGKFNVNGSEISSTFVKIYYCIFILPHMTSILPHTRCGKQTSRIEFICLLCLLINTRCTHRLIFRFRILLDLLFGTSRFILLSRLIINLNTLRTS